MLAYLLLATPGSPTQASGKSGLPAEMHEQPAEVLGVLLDPVVLGLDVLALEEPQHVLLELPRPFARDDLDQRRLLGRRLVENRLQRAVDVLPAVVNVVQVKLELHGSALKPVPWTTAMIAATACSGSFPLGTTVTRGSSGCGGSSTSNWVPSRPTPKKWPCRLASRRAASARETLRKKIRACGRPSSSSSRKAGLIAEHVTTADSPRAMRSSIRAVMARSHGWRSASVSGIPAAILAMFAAGWNASASANGHPRRAASASPTVVLPLPDTPATIRIIFVPLRAA